MALLAGVAAALPAQEVASARDGGYGIGATWEGGAVPPSGSTIVIAHALTGSSLSVRKGTSVVVRASGSLRLTSGLSIAGGSFSVEGGTVTIGPGGGGDKQLSLAKGELVMSGGRIEVNGRVTLGEGAFTMRGGEMVIDANGGNPSVSIAENSDILSVGSGLGGTVDGGAIIIVDPPLSGRGRAFAYGGSKGDAAWIGSTLVLGRAAGANQSASANGFAIDTAANGRSHIRLGHVTVAGGAGPNRHLSGPANPANGFDIGGTLTIAAGAEVRTIAGGPRLCIQGDLANSGRFIDDNGIRFGQRKLPATEPQVVTRGPKGLFATSDPRTQGGATQIFSRLAFDNTATPAVSFNPEIPGSVNGYAVVVLAQLDFINGAIDPGLGQQFLIYGTCAVTRTAGHLIRDGYGEMIAFYPAGRSSFTYHLGDRDGTYLPVTITFSANSYPDRAMSLFMRKGAHPRLRAPDAPAAHLERWWNLVVGASPSPSTFSASMVLTYAPGDLVGDAATLAACQFVDQSTTLPLRSTVSPEQRTVTVALDSGMSQGKGDIGVRSP